MAKIITNTSFATWWPNIQLMQMASTGMKYKDIVPRNIAHQICEKDTFLEKKYTKKILNTEIVDLVNMFAFQLIMEVKRIEGK